MSAISNQPTTRNFLNTTGFKLLMKRAPNIQWFVQKLVLPAISIDSPEQQTPFVPVPYPGVQMKYQPLQMSFKVAEDFSDYMEIFNWLHGTATMGQTTFKPLSERPTSAGDGIKSDIVLMMLDSSKNPFNEIVFHDCFPTALGSINFSSTESSTDYPVVDTTFRYTDYVINRV